MNAEEDRRLKDVFVDQSLGQKQPFSCYCEKNFIYYEFELT